MMVWKPAFFARIGRDLEGALALRHRHREELALLAGNEYAVNTEILVPVRQVAGEALLVDLIVGRERRQRRRPDTLHVRA